MPKYLTLFKYSTEGTRGFMKDKASGRVAAVKRAVESLGGRVETQYWVNGAEYSGVVIWDFPDAASFAAFGNVTGASGMFSDAKTFELLTTEDMDRALGKTAAYRSPGT